MSTAQTVPESAHVNAFQQMRFENLAPVHTAPAPPWTAGDFASGSNQSSLEEMLMFDDFVDVDFEAVAQPPLGMDVNWYGFVQSAQGMGNMAENDGWQT